MGLGGWGFGGSGVGVGVGVGMRARVRVRVRVRFGVRGWGCAQGWGYGWGLGLSVQVGCAKSAIISLGSPCTAHLTYLLRTLTIISLGSPCTIAGECAPRGIACANVCAFCMKKHWSRLSLRCTALWSTRLGSHVLQPSSRNRLTLCRRAQPLIIQSLCMQLAWSWAVQLARSMRRTASAERREPPPPHAKRGTLSCLVRVRVLVCVRVGVRVRVRAERGTLSCLVRVRVKVRVGVSVRAERGTLSCLASSVEPKSPR